MLEKRRCKGRISASQPVTVIESSAEAKANIEAKLLDISACGLGITCHTPLKVDEKVKLEFSLPGFDQLNPLKIEAQVIHITPYQHDYLMGLEFNKITAHTQLVIKEYANFRHRFQA